MRRWILGLLAGGLFAAGMLLLAGCGGTKPQETEVVPVTPPPQETEVVPVMPPPSETEPLEKEQQSAFGAFALRFAQEAVSQAQAEGTKNPLLSPVSAYTAMLMTACGSDGVSRDEFEELLGAPAEQWIKSGSAWMRFLNQTVEGLAVRSANSVWVDEETEVRETYLDQVSKELYAEVFHARLSSQETMDKVNAWVSERTDGMIPAFRTEPYEEEVRLAILNALYLEASWAEPFKAQLTQEETFHAPDGDVRTLFLRDYMGNRDYVRDAGTEGILLPYQNSSLAFLALRATDGRTPQELLADLSFEKLQALVDLAERTLMDFSMPKLAVEYRQDLREVFWELGLRRTMTFGEADLSLMGSGRDGAPLYIGDVQQAVKLQVDEEGTKAAAVTEVAPEDGAACMEDPLVLCLDSPYLYFVLDTESGAPLFVGVAEQPAR